jgi:hypothetical protein
MYIRLQGMKFSSYLKQDDLKHEKDLIEINEYIQNELKNYPNFEGIDFCDVAAYGIQIRGMHKDIKNYSYGDSITIKYDFSNKEQAKKDFVAMWKSVDNAKSLKTFKSFIKDGEKWGWD